LPEILKSPASDKGGRVLKGTGERRRRRRRREKREGEEKKVAPPNRNFCNF